MVKPDLTNAPGIIKNYYVAGICVPEKFWKLVAEVLSRLYIYAPKSSVSGSGNPDYYWNLTNSGYAPNVTVYWRAG